MNILRWSPTRHRVHQEGEDDAVDNDAHEDYIIGQAMV